MDVIRRYCPLIAIENARVEVLGVNAFIICPTRLRSNPIRYPFVAIPAPPLRKNETKGGTDARVIATTSISLWTSISLSRGCDSAKLAKLLPISSAFATSPALLPRISLQRGMDGAVKRRWNERWNDEFSIIGSETAREGDSAGSLMIGYRVTGLTEC